MFHVPKVLDDKGVTGDSSPAVAIETTEGLRSVVGVMASMKVVSVVVVLLDMEDAGLLVGE